MKKVLHISKYYYPFIGGIEQVARDVVRALQGKFEQKVLCFGHEKNENPTIIDNVEVIRCKCQCKIFSQSISLEMNWRFKDLLVYFKPDYIIFHYPNPFFASILLRNIPKETKLILYWHLDIIRQKILGKIFHFQNMALLKRADKIIATSPNYIDGSKYLSKFKSKCVIIPNCIDETRLTQTSKAKEIAEKIKQENMGKTICLSVGRLVPYKGFNYLIKSAQKLDNHYIFYIIGDGEQKKALQRQSKNCPSVKFLGKLTDDELKAYYIAADIFCFSSITKNEAFGIALAEAMYFGLPTVTYTIPGSGVNYVSLNGETGLEVPNRDTVAFANAIKELSSTDKKNYYGPKAYLRIMEKFLFNQFKSNLATVMAE
ncbi:glycosyltransferase [Fibrobacter sp.]|uniref:glycosyltransferase n=1 Tax=Fibrobacter sp. TaxID=35828 RepID=UPI0025BBBD90|nr:glycosyltransferase [Fibrobacter sp.]MBR3071705.1 glycosyltransferase [Fibrobacter sp.]